MSDQTKLALLSDSFVGDTVRSAGAAKSFAAGGKVKLRKRPRKSYRLRPARSFEEGGPVEADEGGLSAEEARSRGLEPIEPNEDEGGGLSPEEAQARGLTPIDKTEYSAPAEAAKRVGKAILPGLGVDDP